jgi:hypothetical protein
MSSRIQRLHLLVSLVASCRHASLSCRGTAMTSGASDKYHRLRAAVTAWAALPCIMNTTDGDTGNKATSKTSDYGTTLVHRSPRGTLAEPKAPTKRLGHSASASDMGPSSMHGVSPALATPPPARCKARRGEHPYAQWLRSGANVTFRIIEEVDGCSAFTFKAVGITHNRTSDAVVLLGRGLLIQWRPLVIYDCPA